VTRDERERQLSVVIPAYNESQRIAEPLGRIDAWLQTHEPSSEIVVVDDGSTDGTADVVRDCSRMLRTPVIVVGSSPNRGKGYAVRVGMMRAQGRALLLTDADLSTPIEELEKLRRCLAEGAAIAIGSRKMAGAVVEIRQPLLRESMGRVFTLLSRLLLLRVSDVTCGFKLFTREAAAQIFPRMTLDDWSFDAEALFLARRLGLEIREVPVRWRDAQGTKVNRTRDALRSALGLLRIALNAARGRYGLHERAARLRGRALSEERPPGPS